MQNHPHDPIDRSELEASLRRLGVQELEERLEVSTLLTGAVGADPADGGTICCTCKIPAPNLDENGSLPYPSSDPGSDIGGVTGPL